MKKRSCIIYDTSVMKGLNVILVGIFRVPIARFEGYYINFFRMPASDKLEFSGNRKLLLIALQFYLFTVSYIIL